MRAVDTNALVRLIVRDDLRQAQEAEAFIEQGVWVSTLVLAEAAWVLISVYGFTRRQLAQAIAMIIRERHVSVQDSEAVEAAVELFASTPSIEFTDCLILELARKHGHLPLGTSDRKLARLPGAKKMRA
jgi:predicted nucleic acid-binding protein